MDGKPVSVGIKGIDCDKAVYWMKGDSTIVTEIAICSETPIYVIFVGEYEVEYKPISEIFVLGEMAGKAYGWTSYSISKNSPNGKSSPSGKVTTKEDYKPLIHLSPEDRYHRDPYYHALVHSIYSLIEKAEFTPTEVREAAMFACILYDQRHSRPLRF
ncbi:MAG: hypothetical protein ACE14V_01365 [bacterium]